MSTENPEQKKKGGRPKDPVRRVPLSLRVTPEVRAKLDSLAMRSSRSISQEAELRLEQSFHDEALLNQVLALKYGPAPAGLLRLMGEAMMEVGFSAAYDATQKTENLENWPSIPTAFAAAKHAAIGILNCATPGELDDDQEKAARTKGLAYAKAVVSVAKDPSGTPLYEKDSREIAEMLGPVFERMTVARVKGQ